MRRALPAAIVLAEFAVLATCAAPAIGFPAILTSRTAGNDITQRLEERPATISYTENNVRLVAGSFLGFGTDPGPDFGPLGWTTYNDVEAVATGIAYVEDCTATTCNDAPFVSVPASVRAHAPKRGYFTRLTIKYRYHGRTVTEHDRVAHYPADDEGGRAHWGYVVARPEYERCGTVRYHPRQSDRPVRGVVRTNPDDASCATARKVARRATTRVAGVGNRLPAPAGWACSGGFRPTFDNPRPFRIGCFRRGAASTFERSFSPYYQVAVR